MIQSMHESMIVHCFGRRMRLLINVQCVMSHDISSVMKKVKKFLKKYCVIFL